MGRANKWLLLADKAKAFILFKGLKRRSRSKGQSETVVGIGEGRQIPTSPDIKIAKNDDVASAVTLSTTTENESCVSPASPKISPCNVTDSTQVSEDSTDLVTETLTPERSEDELAAVKIQAAFRGARARKKVKAMKALRRLQSMLHRNVTNKQTAHAMRCMQSFAKMQSQVRVQRARSTSFQHQCPSKHDLEKSEDEQVGDWDDSILSEEQIRTKILSKQEAAAKRERSLAYAFSHQQWRSYPKDICSALATNNDNDKPVWSWSWLEQWISTRSWESLEEIKEKVDGPVSTKTPAAIQSPGRSKHQLPVSYKRVIADIQPKFAPTSPHRKLGGIGAQNKTQRKIVSSSISSSPNRSQATALKTAKVHDDCEIEKAMTQPNACDIEKAMTRANGMTSSRNLKSEKEPSSPSPALKKKAPVSNGVIGTAAKYMGEAGLTKVLQSKVLK